MGLTAWQAVLQSQAIHPGWTVEDHLEWMVDEGYDLSTLRPEPGKDVVALLRWWMADNVSSGRVAKVRGEAFSRKG